MEKAVVSFKIEKSLLDEFDAFLRGRGIYVRSEGIRRAIIKVLQEKNCDLSPPSNPKKEK